MEIAKLVLEYIQALIWPGIILFIAIYFKNETSALLGRIKSATLPGGVSFDLNDKIQEVKALSNEVQETVSAKQERNKGKPTIPLTEANSRLIKLGLRPSPSGMDMNYYLDIASQDPNLALAGLRIDVDILVRNLAKGFGIPVDDKRNSTVRILKKLLEDNCIYQSQYELAVKVLSLCNQAIHGSPMTYEQAQSVIVSAEALVDDYIAWMSWGFDDNWQPQNGN
jgi:hypothetical protein